MFRTELIYQINDLLNQVPNKEIASLVGFTIDGLRRSVQRYYLPKTNFGDVNEFKELLKLDTIEFLNAKNLSKELGEPINWIYDVYKFHFVNQINNRLNKEMDAKSASKEVGVSYDKCRYWIESYNLPF